MRSVPLLLCFFVMACAPTKQLGELTQVLGHESGIKNPFGVAFDDKGSMIIAEYLGGRLWEYTASGELKQLARDTPFNGMHNLARTKNGQIYISETRANLIRKLDETTGELTIVAGTGESGYNGDGILATQAMLADPISISLSHDDKELYVCDIKNFRVRVIDLTTGIIRTAAGNGTSAVPEDGAIASESPLIDPRGAAADSQGNLYILSRKGHALRVVRPDGKIYTVAGTGEAHAADGPALQAGMNGPKHLCIDLKCYDPKRKTLTTILDHGPDGSPLNRPHGVWIRSDGALYICDSWNDRILKLTR
jgi:sugar lactone lactonase YvrE